MDHDYCDEAHLQPLAGHTMRIQNTDLIWQAVQLRNDIIDFNSLLGKYMEWNAAYAVCYIQSDTDKENLRLLVGSDDDAKVYLNGRQVYEYAQRRRFAQDEDAVEGIHLERGMNTLVFKVVNQSADWMGSLRLTDSAGQPVSGLHVTLER